MTKKISKDWHKWIKINLDRGCDLDEMHAILMKEGFAPPDIKKSLGYEPVFSGLEDNDVLSKESKTSFFKKIPKDWDKWIKINLDRGCDLDEIHAILMKEGFCSTRY